MPGGLLSRSLVETGSPRPYSATWVKVFVISARYCHIDLQWRSVKSQQEFRINCDLPSCHQWLLSSHVTYHWFYHNMLINLTNYHIMWHDFDETHHILWHGNHHVAIHVLTCHEACPLPHSLSFLRRCWGRPTRKSVGLAVWSCYWFGDWSADAGAPGSGRWSDRSTQCAGSLPLQKEHKKYINLQV